MTTATSWSGRRAAFPAATRRLILDRSAGRCQIAGPDCIGTARIADHIIPMAEGGTHDPANGQAACDPCHDAKTRDEIARGRARRSRKRPPPPHPGLVER